MDEIASPDLTAQHPKGEWVSKSDLVGFLRCPYAFWLLDTGQIRSWQALGWPSPQPRHQGLQVRHEEVLEIARRSLPARIRGFVLDSRVFRNDDRKILGRPDGVRITDGTLFPVVIKVTGEDDIPRTDELALAFYWLVLKPYQEVGEPERRGYVIALPRWLLKFGPQHLQQPDMFDEILAMGRPKVRRVRLRRELFDEVLATCEAIRRARRDGVKPRICKCPYCDSRPKIVRAAMKAKDLTCIWGIDRRRAASLERLGVHSYADFLDGDADQLVQQCGVSPRTMAGWQAHGRSYEERRAVYFGEDRLKFQDMLVFDLEYQGLTIGDDSRIWLIGICAVVSGRQKYEFLWADSPLKERRNILTLFERLEKSGRMPVVTWSGRTADLPQLRNAMTRLRIRRSCHALFARHIDALAFLCSNMRLPIPAFGLKDVAEYFGIARESGVADGREANVMYRQYREARGKEKTSLRRELQGYNRDDLRCVAEIVGRLASV